MTFNYHVPPLCLFNYHVHSIPFNYHVPPLCHSISPMPIQFVYPLYAYSITM